MEAAERKTLKKFSAQLRIDQLEMFKQRGMGHIGGCLSVTELISVLYGKQMKYDPANPQKSVLAGSNSANWMIFMGLFFVLGSTVFILAWLTVKGCFDRFKVSVLGVYIGVVFTFVGAGPILLRRGETGSWPACFKSFGLWILIPLMMIAVGLFQTVKCLLPGRSKKGEKGR